MYRIEEVKSINGKAYNVELGNYKRQVNVISLIKQVEGFTYMVLINSYGTTLREVYQYLNFHLAESSYKKRELSLTALKALYSFMEIFNIDNPRSIDKSYRNKIIGFLQGGENRTVDTEYNLATKRTNNTINNYFAVYRKYYKYLGIENETFSETTTLMIQKGGGVDIGFFTHTQKVKVEKYDISLKRLEKKEVPKYIRFQEYKEVLNIIEQKYSLREKVICKLMYEYGLRIGEVLGLTLEDFWYNEDLYDTGDCSIVLRNRLSDKPYQFAKGCMKVSQEKVYNHTDYYEEDIGYQTIRISSDMALLIQEYIDETRSPFNLSEKTQYNLTNKNIADKVLDRECIEVNQYIFLGKNFTPITSKGWNDNLKKIFNDAGIQVDKGKKTDNLNHRFRHGFAMFKVMVEKYDLLRLSDALRHSNSNSSLIYFKPTEEDRKAFANLSQTLLEKGGITID